MRRRSICLIALALSLSGYRLPASDARERTAIVVDTGGTTSEVTGLRIEGRDNNLFTQVFGDNMIAFDAEPFQLGIPLGAVISVDVKGKIWNVKYNLKQQERMISGGSLNIGDFQGKTDLGGFTLAMDKLRNLTFKDRPATSEQPPNQSLVYDTVLVLTTGKRIPVANFRRVTIYCPSEGYNVGCNDRYDYFADIRFLRGEALQAVPFEKIKIIDFTQSKSSNGRTLQGSVTVTLRNGNSVAGKLTSGPPEASIDGYTGIYENADFSFYIFAEHVKRILFGEVSK